MTIAPEMPSTIPHPTLLQPAVEVLVPVVELPQGGGVGLVIDVDADEPVEVPVLGFTLLGEMLVARVKSYNARERDGIDEFLIAGPDGAMIWVGAAEGSPLKVAI